MIFFSNYSISGTVLDGICAIAHCFLPDQRAFKLNEFYLLALYLHHPAILFALSPALPNALHAIFMLEIDGSGEVE